jgi:uncharacterized protein (TIGR04255 family)
MNPRKMRTRRPPGLPDFRDPPLTEVALSIQFEALTPAEFVDLGPFWQRIKPRFPNVEMHPPLPASFEIFGAPPGPQVQFSIGPIVPRYWFLSRGGNEILQFQPDRFVHNWRKVGVVPEYPRYERIRRTFFGEFARLDRLMEQRHGRALMPNQCEITYVNQVPAPESGRDLTPECLAVFRWPEGFPAGSPEDVGMQIRLVLPGADGQPVGRLNIQSNPVVTAGGTRALQLVLTARGRPITPNVDSAMEFMDKGRKIIVESFAALTTDSMHKLWGRRK